MDRCRCDEYKNAVEKLKYYGVGSFSPEYIKNYDRTNYSVIWKPKKIDVHTLTFEKARAVRILTEEESQDPLSKEARKIEQMMCPYMYNPRTITAAF